MARMHLKKLLHPTAKHQPGKDMEQHKINTPVINMKSHHLRNNNKNINRIQ